MGSHKIWIRGQFEFGAMYSYRIPNFSTAFAPCSPTPGPSTVKLALTATRIEATGSVIAGEELFEAVKNAKVCMEPPKYLAMTSLFQRRMKRMKTGKLDRSFGTREYAHVEGPLRLYIEVGPESFDLIADTMHRLRRIGTSDSLLCCTDVSNSEPDLSTVARPLENFRSMFDVELFRNRPVVPLQDLKPDVTFSHVNPYSKSSGNFTQSITYIFPLRKIQSGDGWVMYERQAFED